MKLSPTYKVNAVTLEKKLLIVTQGSEYKDVVVENIVNHFKTKQVYIKVTDASYLPQIEADKWDAIALLHTWEIEKPPMVVSDFVYKYPNLKTLVVISTSGGGDEKLAGVDAISSASILEDIPNHSTWIINKLNLLLEISETSN